MSQEASANSEPHPSTLPPTVFPPSVPWPDHIPVRHKPWTEELERLDASNPNPPLADWEDDKEWRSSQRTREHAEYLDSRQPYCEFASERLQAIAGVRNEYEFQLPTTVNGTPEASASASSSASGPSLAAPIMMPAMRRVLDSEVSVSNTTRKRSRTATPIHPRLSGTLGNPGIGAAEPRLETFEVDRETGKGLRNYMLNMGAKHGMRRVVCDSFTFFDHTPTMKRAEERMELLMHFIKQNGYRLEAYEIDIPTTYTNERSGEKTTIQVTWIWFYLSHALIDLPSAGGPLPPRTFPSPPPTSWIAFALPLSHANKYETITEYQAAPLPGKVHKRTDYDISFSGLPIIEFSGTKPWLMMGWNAYLQRRAKIFDDEDLGYEPYDCGAAGRFLSLGCVVPDEEDGLGEMGWMQAFYRRVFDDVWMWEKVRRVMGRGGLRLVIRWCEDVGGVGVGGGMKGMGGEGSGGGGDDDDDDDDDIVEIERPVGFGSSRGSSLGKRGRRGRVPQPLSLGMGGAGAGMGRDQVVSRGLGPSMTDPAAGMNVRTEDPMDLDPEIESLMDFHFGNGQLDRA